MIVVIALETRFVETPDGVIWSLGWLDRSFWNRYLDVFEGVRVIARVARVSSRPENARRADSPGVKFCPVPNYRGPWQFVTQYRRLKKQVAGWVDQGRRVIDR